MLNEGSQAEEDKSCMLVITSTWNHRNTKTKAAEQLLDTESMLVVARGG